MAKCNAGNYAPALATLPSLADPLGDGMTSALACGRAIGQAAALRGGKMDRFTPNSCGGALAGILVCWRRSYLPSLADRLVMPQGTGFSLRRREIGGLGLVVVTVYGIARRA